MTDDIKPTVQEKSAWAKVPQEFNDWWNSDYSDESNPFRINSAVYWAWAGWSEAVRLNAQNVQAVPVGVIERAIEALTYCEALNRNIEHQKLRSLTELHNILSAAPAAPQPAQQPLTDEKDALLRQALEALEGFIHITNDSQGVAGYHLSGDTAEWDEFDEADAAISAIEAIRQNLGVKND